MKDDVAMFYWPTTLQADIVGKFLFDKTDLASIGTVDNQLSHQYIIYFLFCFFEWWGMWGIIIEWRMALAAGQRTAFSVPDDAVGWPGLIAAEPAERAGWRGANPRPHDCKANALPLRRAPSLYLFRRGFDLYFTKNCRLQLPFLTSIALLDSPNALLIVQNWFLIVYHESSCCYYQHF